MLSLGVHGVSNMWGQLSFVFEFIVALVLLYIPAIEFAINTRAIAIPHFMIPAVTFSVLIFFYDEARKFFVRKGITRTTSPDGTRIKYDGWIASNTCY